MKVLTLAEARGLRVIWSGPSTWEGRPDWWREDAPYEVCARDDLMAALETAWRGMGKAFRGHPAHCYVMRQHCLCTRYLSPDFHVAIEVNGHGGRSDWQAVGHKGSAFAHVEV